MTVDAWLKAWREASIVNDTDGLSMVEIGELWGVGISGTQKRIRQLVSQGHVKFIGYKSATSMTGTPVRVPCYALNATKGD
jgi:hypothetical protein